MNKKLGQVVVLLAHPNLNESVANKELLNSIKDTDGVMVYNLYDDSPDLLNPETWSRILSNASMLIFQFPLRWMSAPFMLKRWLDEVFTYIANTPAVAGKSLQAVVTTASESEAFRSGGRKQFTVDELLRPYQVCAIASSMIWQTPLIIYGTASVDPAKNITQGAIQYKKIIDKEIKNVTLEVSEW